MKVNTFVQYLGREIQTEELEKKIKDIWKAKGGLVKDLKSVELYLKVEEGMCYYVINGNITGGFPLE